MRQYYACKNCSCVRACEWVQLVHNTAQNSSGNLPSDPPDNYHSSDDTYWREGEARSTGKTDQMTVNDAIRSQGSHFWKFLGKY